MSSYDLPSLLASLLLGPLKFGLILVWISCTLLALWHFFGRRLHLARAWGATSFGVLALVSIGAIGMFVMANLWVGCSLHGGCPRPRPMSYYILGVAALIYFYGILAWAVRRMLRARRLGSA